MIKELLRKGLRKWQISILLGIKKEKVSNWSQTEIKDHQQKPKKLKDICINKVYKLDNNEVTNLRSSRKIANTINSVLKKIKKIDKNCNQISVHYTTVNNYLKQYLSKPQKIRKVFFLKKEQKKKMEDLKVVLFS